MYRPCFERHTKVSQYDQKEPQSETTDQPTIQQGKDTEHKKQHEHS